MKTLLKIFVFIWLFGVVGGLFITQFTEPTKVQNVPVPTSNSTEALNDYIAAQHEAHKESFWGTMSNSFIVVIAILATVAIYCVGKKLVFQASRRMKQ